MSDGSVMVRVIMIFKVAEITGCSNVGKTKTVNGRMKRPSVQHGD